MEIIEMPVGYDSFDEIRSNDCYYVDKTLLIKQLLTQKSKVTLITRPRRFGKSLNMSMLDCFFDIRKDSNALFDGLSISNEKELCEKWMNKYPTIFISFKDVDANNFDNVFDVLELIISKLFEDHSDLLENGSMKDNQKVIFKKIIDRTENYSDLVNSIHFLSQIMNEYYKEQTVILIDEYDVPMAQGNSNGYYHEITKIMRLILGRALKGNPYLKFAVLTGCLRIAKESIFTGLNNFCVDSIADDRFDEYFGFTDSEMDRLLEDTKLTDLKSEIKEWYDGYRFGNVEVYCPWDVINYVAQLQYNPKIKPRNYWANTSGNDIIRNFLHSEIDVSDDFEMLLRGEYIEKTILENITYNELTSGEENFWTVLYLTGYLTTVDTADELYESSDSESAVKLKIPNKEIRNLFESTIAKWFKDNIAKDNRSELFNYIWNGDQEKLTVIINDYLYSTISYFDYNENYYHAFLAGLLSGMKGYIVKSNSESGNGRADIILKDKKNKRVAIFELKRAKKEDEMSTLCNVALQQIEDNNYAQPFDNGEKVTKFGITFFKKKCLIQVSK